MVTFKVKRLDISWCEKTYRFLFIKMKLALILLLSFVSVYSYHQLPHRSYYYDPRLFFYYPNAFGFPYYNSPVNYLLY